MTESPLNPAPLEDMSPAAVKPRPGLRPRNIVLGLLVAIACFVIWGIGTFVYVCRMIHSNMEKAEAHAVILRNTIAQDQRFSQITFSSFTGDNGSLLVNGLVHSQADLIALRQIIAASKPPVLVGGPVRVVPSAASRSSTLPSTTAPITR